MIGWLADGRVGGGGGVSMCVDCLQEADVAWILSMTQPTVSWALAF